MIWKFRSCLQDDLNIKNPYDQKERCSRQDSPFSFPLFLVTAFTPQRSKPYFMRNLKKNRGEKKQKTQCRFWLPLSILSTILKYLTIDNVSVLDTAACSSSRQNFLNIIFRDHYPPVQFIIKIRCELLLLMVGKSVWLLLLFLLNLLTLLLYVTINDSGQLFFNDFTY